MAENTCRRELQIEVPADVVRQATETVARSFQKQARIAGFRPGKAPLSLVRERFAGEIQQRVLEQLIPEHFRGRVQEEKLEPVATPHFDDVHLKLQGDEPLRFKAVFEVLPEFELKDYHDLEVEYAEPTVTDEEVEEALKRMRKQAATFAPVEGRPLADGDFAQLSMEGRPLAGPAGSPSGKAAPVKVDDLLCEVGGADTLPEFTAQLRGAEVGAELSFPVNYPADYSDTRLAGRTFQYKIKVHSIRQRQLPEWNDEMARDLGEFETLEQLRAHIRSQLLEQKRRRGEAEARDRLLDRLVEMHDFPVPEAMVERQIESRLERTLRSLAAQGVNIGQLKTDWRQWRAQQREAARRDVQAGLLLDRIAERESLEVTEEEIENEIKRLSAATRQSLEVVRARLSGEGSSEKLKSRIRSEKTQDFLFRDAKHVPPKVASS